MRRTLLAALALLAAAVLGEDRVFQGHYASGLAKYTVKGAHVYRGHYASGLADWTTGTSADLLRVFQGHYASGLAKFTFRSGHLYRGHYASGLADWTTGTSSGLLRVYRGHYASGLAKFTFKDGHVYRGHYASGLAAWTFKTTDEVPEGLLVFLVTQVLEPADDGVAPDPVVPVIPADPVYPVVTPPAPVPPDPVTPSKPEPMPPSGPVVRPPDPVAPQPAACWRRARVLRGVLEEDGVVTAGVEVKCGKADRRGEAKIAVTVTPFTGSRRAFRAQKAAVSGARAASVWTREGLRLAVDGDGFAGALDAGAVLRSAAVGGALREGGHRLTVRPEGPAGTLKGYVLDETALPVDGVFQVAGGRWRFASGDPARVRLSYNASKGAFKGTFRARYAPDGDASGRRRARAVSVKAAGLVVDGAGVGAAASRPPAQRYAVSVK